MDSNQTDFMGKYAPAIFPLIGVLIGGAITAFSNWWSNKRDEKRERREKLRQNLTSIFFQGRRMTGRDYTNLISSCEHCMTLLYLKDEDELEGRLYGNVRTIMDRAIKEFSNPAYESMDALIEETMSLAHKFFSRN